MPETNLQQTLNTNASELRLNRFEAVWLVWSAGEAVPRWQDHLPADDEPCTPQLIFNLLQLDIECRVKAGLAALLSEAYFEHPRVQRDDARLDAERQVELIRWEYQQRWQKDQSARRAEYEAAFPRHLEALRDMKPRWRCPRCHKILVLEEALRTLLCPHCGTHGDLLDTSPPFVAEPMSLAVSPEDLDWRGYHLLDELGKGGMGEVYRCSDPALGRDVAIKVIKALHRGRAEVERRFLREARITGALQHPGIVPVHNLGRLRDGRLHYTMRLVRGRTFAEILKEQAGKREQLPYLLSIFEKICQAAAYAHSKRVLHRDLKPSNIMVGRFGEVQVMDWGLAKVLTPDDAATESDQMTEATATRIPTELDTSDDLSRTGSAFGTLQYMPSEQARGKWGLVDERADVFALGSILCEMLTGQPAYIGTSSDELRDRAERGDVGEALARLERCDADAALTALCRECLNPQREARPRNAGVVAVRVAAYQAEVQERLREAELERVAAETRAREEQARALVEQERTREALARVHAERRARRRTLALAVLVLVLMLGGGGGWWWQRRQREQADRAVSNALAKAELLAEQAREEPLQTDKYRQALEVARGAAQLAQIASADLRQKAEDLSDHLQRQEEATRKDQALLAALLDVRGPHEGPKYQSDAKGRMRAMAEPTADEQFAAAFRRWGLDVDGASQDQAKALLKARPPVVVIEMSAALDEWASERRRQGKAKEEWQRLADLAALLDDDPDSKRRELRQMLAQGRLPMERALDVLSAALRPVPVPVELPLGPERQRLRQLAEGVDVAHEPVLGLLTLVRALGVAGERARAEQLLQAAIVARPREVVLYHTLGELLVSPQPPRWAEAVECYRAARTLRPSLGVSLATALRNSGRDREGLALLAQLVRETPANPYLHLHLAYTLYAKGQLDKAIDEYHRAIALGRNLAQAHNNLGVALGDKGQLDEAIDEYHRAIALDDAFAPAHYNLGNAHYEMGQLDEAIDEYRKAIAHNSEHVLAHNNLGNALYAKERLDEAIIEYRLVLARHPTDAPTHVNLGNALRDKEQLEEAIVEYQRTIRLNPDLAGAHCSLGFVLQMQGRFEEALASLRRGHELGSKPPGWHRPSLQWVRDAERLLVLDKKLPAILSGEESSTNPGEAVVLAWMCQLPYKKCYAASARLYTDAFTTNPKLADNLNQQHRYNAACSAVFAGAGKGGDARLRPDKVVTMFRRWALGWLRGDLTAYANLAARNNPALNTAIQQRLRHWKIDPNLVSVRGPTTLDRLPDNERAAWQALWRDVDELAKRVSKTDNRKTAKDKRKP